jgi:hypothetical protein
MVRGALSLVVFLVVFPIFVCACPPADKGERAPGEAEPAGCARVGQTCAFSPGKLGTCLLKAGCVEATASCFVCQSQH